jgi:hypothetical protein
VRYALLVAGVPSSLVLEAVHILIHEAVLVWRAES